MIVITNPISIANEICTIHSLFENGLELLHIRKPNFGETEMKQFLSDINHNYRERLVLHNYHCLAEKFNIKRIHISESKRKVTLMLPSKLPFDTYTRNGFHLSTSVHTIEDFNALENVFEYAFLSPVYPSISKENYFSKTDMFEAVKNRNNYTTKLIALGGIESKNIKQTLKNGFDNVALLGTIWNRNNPIENFKSCQQIVQSY
ncbi:thiamine phosphate synthase [Flavobacterium aquicola]|uniref:Thiamine-phosphate pyrophosphorylase n=1 Tax=Flavobacterium aquicola TaxID=1682742 RepID=A0A3E0EQW0_9FLAO|nr:thiamine phosphate synthase [Flavobacterium aquicola]REH00154.1 thiamine-phosphate pyrophosphorylase [Flavobacterium aquicola]